MSFLTKYGSFWGFVPITSGRLFWVAPSGQYTIEGNVYSSSDNNDGLSPERALRTVDYAVGLTTANVGDVIILLPGSHSITTPVLVDVAGITITGIPGTTAQDTVRNTASKRKRSTITSTQTAGIIFSVSAVDCEISHIGFLPPAAGGRGISLAPLSGAANRTYIHDCTFSLIATASVTTYGITVPAGVTADLLEDTLISHCYFVSGGSASSGANGPGVNVLGTAHGLTIENSTFELKGTAAWASAITTSNAGTLGLLIREVDFMNPTSATTVITTAVTNTGQTVDASLAMYRCYFDTGTDAITGSATADGVLAECYLASAAGGALATNA